jgi:hypothetical protein
MSTAPFNDKNRLIASRVRTTLLAVGGPLWLIFFFTHLFQNEAGTISYIVIVLVTVLVARAFWRRRLADWQPPPDVSRRD